MTFPDFQSYIAAKERAIADYGDRTAWAKKMLVNIAKSGFFSSDRTIQQYNEAIWHLKTSQAGGFAAGHSPAQSFQKLDCIEKFYKKTAFLLVNSGVLIV